MHLYNRVNGEELKAKLLQSGELRATLSFYRYVKIEDPRQFRDDLFATWAQIGVLGRIYVAHEGINAQMSMPEAQKEAFISWIQAHPLLTGVRLNWAVEDDGKSFYKLVIKVRHKIVADGLDDASFDPGNTGKYLSARDFNELTEQPGTVVVDMRNHYESEIGHFEGAICPDVDTFRDSLPIVRDMLKPFQDQPIVMYCTGGIRCEKASAWLKHEGFGQVYHLEGGIIKYARDAKEQGLKNKFRGKNFVFDERRSERIGEEIISVCHTCGKPADTHHNCRNAGCNVLYIQCDECLSAYENCCSDECKTIAQLPESEQIAWRKSQEQPVHIYTKGRRNHPETA